ncbi:cytochrome b [Marinobacter halodurans]|uniref:Cytochrome b n=1 Tax=Marinobacter halodurans TaxID=2528979 RepID=A0ABY1ZMA3_9GAMM|nr:cytochrome b [Marinobacter halodurans]TBW56883.1 cytochrome b [Marinobacter halodurans]
MAFPLMNSRQQFGWVTILIHWLVAVAVFGLFGLGLYMVELTYYDAWYNEAPHIHESIGILVLLAMFFRVAWRLVSPPPVSLPSHRPWEKAGAHVAHFGMYLLLFAVLVSGYLIPTADGSGVDVFNWFTVPSVTGQQKGLESVAGDIHYWVAWGLVILAVIHAIGAIKHHVIDRDETLRRMMGLKARPVIRPRNDSI